MCDITSSKSLDLNGNKGIFGEFFIQCVAVN